jgi:hypothetical protein
MFSRELRGSFVFVVFGTTQTGFYKIRPFFKEVQPMRPIYCRANQLQINLVIFDATPAFI